MDNRGDASGDAHGEQCPLLAKSCAAPSTAGHPNCGRCTRRKNAVQDNLYRMCHIPALHAPAPRNTTAVADYCYHSLLGRRADGAAAVGGGRGGAEEEEEATLLLPTAPSSVTVEHYGSGSGSVSSKIKKHHPPPLQPQVRAIVRTVYALAFCTMAIMMAISPMMLLYMRHVHLISASNVQFYVTCNVISSASPVLLNAGLGFLAGHVGPARALALSSAAVAVGLLGMAVAHSSKILFALAFALYSVLQCLKTIRTLIIAEYVPHEFRTEVMSIHALMTPLGALVGPLIWLAVERFRGDLVLVGSLRLNKYTLNYGLAILVLVVIASTAMVRLGQLPGQARDKPASAPSSSGDTNDVFDTQTNGDETGSDAAAAAIALPHVSNNHIHLSLSDGREFDVDPDRYRQRIFIYFSVVMACVNVSMGLYSVAWQPIMVNVYGADGQKLGVIFEIISICAVVPPLLVAYLSRHMQDRHILLIGICSKLIGIAFFLPIFGRVREWQVVCGFIVIIKASIFFFTATMSLFTKLLGGMTSGILLGILSSVSAVGPALAQLFFTDYMLARFGSLGFGLFGLPVVFALCLVLWPWFWTRLDPTREFTRKFLDEYEALHPKPAATH
jgi:MFS family permease